MSESLEAQLSARMSKRLDSLAECTAHAQASKEHSDALRRFSAPAGELLRALQIGEAGPTDAQYSVLAVIGVEKVAVIESVMSALKAFNEPLRAATGDDRSEGDKWATQIRATIASPDFDDYPEAEKLQARAVELLAAWDASAPSKKSVGARGPRAATGQAGGKVLYCQCDKCGAQMSDSTGLNSARSAFFHKHWASKHNAGVKLDNKDQRWVDVTSALGKVEKDGGSVSVPSVGLTFSDSRIADAVSDGSEVKAA